jgi:opacity protein-like surface antigen
MREKMNRRVAGFAAAVLSLSATAVSAQTAGFYAAVPSTAALSSSEASLQSQAPSQTSSALGQSASVGYDFGGGFRTEVENFRSGAGPDPVTGSERSSNSVMLTGIYDIPTGRALKPYVGAGFGAIAQRQGIPGTASEQWTNGYQFRGGLSYEISQAVRGLLEYRLQGGSGPSTKFEVKSKGVVVGLKYQLR